MSVVWHPEGAPTTDEELIVMFQVRDYFAGRLKQYFVLFLSVIKRKCVASVLFVYLFSQSGTT